MTKTTTQTTAHEIAARFRDDGECYSLDDGAMLLDVCRDAAKSIEHADGGHTTIYVFADGSAIVDCVSAWDVRAEGCTGHCWEGGGCECGAQQEQDVKRAAEYLTATPDGDEWAYYAHETGRRYRVSEEDMADLGRRLREGQPDAYSLWCAETSATEE